MSDRRTILPGGTRLAALAALALVACLFAWRANVLLKDDLASPQAQTFEQRQLTSLLEPVFGANNVRVATHAGSEDARQFLILVNSSADTFQIDRPTFDRVVTILEAAAGYNRARDNLHIQPFAFAPGTAGGLQTVDLYELGAIGAIDLLIGFLLVFPTARRSDHAEPINENTPENIPLKRSSDMLRNMAPLSTPANEDEFSAARELAARDPRAAAQIVRRLLSGEDDQS